jgi:hypothetical protein
MDHCPAARGHRSDRPFVSAARAACRRLLKPVPPEGPEAVNAGGRRSKLYLPWHAPRRTNSAHLHRPWRAIYTGARCYNRGSSKTRRRTTPTPMPKGYAQRCRSQAARRRVGGMRLIQRDRSGRIVANDHIGRTAVRRLLTEAWRDRQLSCAAKLDTSRRARCRTFAPPFSPWPPCHRKCR